MGEVKESLKARHIMHPTTLVDCKMKVRDAAIIMRKKKIGSVLITRKGEIAGIMTERDLMNRVVAEGLDPGRLRVEQVMTKDIITINANDSVLKASEIFGKYKFRRLPVEENGKIIGILTTRNVARSMPICLLRITDPESYFQGDKH